MHNRQQESERYRQVRNITVIGAIVNAALGCLKVAFGIIGHSHALFADGIHSFSDLITDGLIIFASRFGSESPDRNHPYGHGRIETAGTVLLALILIFAGAGIILDAGEHMFNVEQTPPTNFVLLVAGISVLANELLYHATKFVANRIQSELLRANAWHHRSDAASSIVVIVGVVGTMLGFIHLDSIAAIVVGIMIIKMGWELGWSSIMELIDTAVDSETLADIRSTILAVSGVESLHQLRTRSMGGKILVDAHIIVNSRLSVSEGHHIGQRVHHALLKHNPAITDVTIHIDPEDDEVVKPSMHLPHREQVLQQLRDRWQLHPLNDHIKRITLHYLDGSIHIDVVIAVQGLEQIADVEVKQQELLQQVSDLEDIGSLTLLIEA